MSASEINRLPPKCRAATHATRGFPHGLAGATLTAGFSRLASTGLSFALLIALTRSLGPVEYGHFVFLLSIGTALGLVFPLGQQVLVLKRYDTQATPSQNWRLLHVNYVWLRRGFIFLVAAAGASNFIDDFGGLYAACLFAAVFALAEYFVNYFRLHGRILLALVPRENAWRALTLLAIPAIILAVPSLTGASAFLIATGLLLSVVAVQAAAFLRQEGLGWLRASDARHPNPTWSKESRFFIGGNVLDASSGHLDTIVIGTFIGLEEAAVYFTALRISKLLELPKLILGTTGVPRIAAAFQTRDLRKAQHLLRLMAVASFFPTAIVATVTYLLRDLALGIFDPSFVKDSGVLGILILVTLFHVAFGTGEQTMRIAGGEKHQLLIYGGLLGVHLMLLAALGSLYGITGVAAASLLHVCARGLVATRWCQANLSVNPTIASAIRRRHRRETSQSITPSPNPSS